MASLEYEPYLLQQTDNHPELNHEMSHPFQVEKGVFYSGVLSPQDFYGRPLNEMGQPDYDTEVAERHDTNVRYMHPGAGSTWVEEWEMSDGTRYDILIGKSARNQTGMLVVKDTAWTTQVQGFNHDIAMMLMREGFDVVIKGPEKGSSIELAHSAHNTHQVLNTIEEIGINDTRQVVVEGYSRGSMIGFGTVGRASLYDRKVIYANLTDACVARPIEFKVSELEETLKGVPAELLTVATELGMLALHPEKLWHYRKTFDASADGMRQIHRTGKPLFTGEAGILAGQLPQDTEATTAFFKNSFANHRELYRRIIKGEDGTLRPGVEVKLAMGGHGRGIGERILGNICLRFCRLGEQLRDGVAPEDIDFTQVHRPA
jgi:hypothetical protein